MGATSILPASLDGGSVLPVPHPVEVSFFLEVSMCHAIPFVIVTMFSACVTVIQSGRSICCEDDEVLNELEEAQLESEKTKWTIGKKLSKLIDAPHTNVHNLEDIFNMWDVSRDGSIDQKEFQAGLESIDIFLTKMVTKDAVASRTLSETEIFAAV